MPLRFSRKRIAVMLSTLCMALPAGAAPNSSQADEMFLQAKRISDRDGGRFWGKRLYGPILFVDPNDLAAVANEADGLGTLKPAGGVFEGQMPKSWQVSSTPVEWAGKRWTELYWPLMGLPGAESKVGNDWLAVTLAHEMFHRIQPSLGLTRPEEPNVQLDTLDGRYLLQLEWRALAAALSARNATARRAAIADAVLFRAARYREFPDAAAREASLEINEGIPEYTGVRLGLPTPQRRLRYALYDLSAWTAVPSFVRSFAYATGPAYGLLLDQTGPSWRGKLNSGQRLDQILATAIGLPSPPLGELASREAHYDDGGRLRAAEVKRDQTRKTEIAAFKARLVDGPVLRIPLAKSNLSFRPQSLVPLEGLGVVYPTLKASDIWGELEVSSGGALVNKDMTMATVSAPGATGLSGDGWHLTLKEGWAVRPAARPGDFILTKK